MVSSKERIIKESLILITKDVTNSEQAERLGGHFFREKMPSLFRPQKLLVASCAPQPWALWVIYFMPRVRLAPSHPCFRGKGERSGKQPGMSSKP